jgi:hypothetical protein
MSKKNKKVMENKTSKVFEKIEDVFSFLTVRKKTNVIYNEDF